MERTLPVCEIAALEPWKTICRGSARYFRSSNVVAPTLIGAPIVTGTGARDAGAVVPRAVRRVEVLDHPLLAPQHEARVVARGVVVADHEAGLARSSDRERLGAERQLEPGLRAARDDDPRDGRAVVAAPPFAAGRRAAARRHGRGGAGRGPRRRGAAPRRAGSGIRRTFTPNRSARSE